MPHQTEPQRSRLEDLFGGPPTGGNNSPSAEDSNDPVLHGPQTDDELHAHILATYGLDIPRKACCPDHQAPFQALADFFFDRVRDAAWLAPRSGGKTQNGSLVQLLKAKFRRGFEGLTGGATLQQAERGYQHLRDFLKRDDSKADVSLKKETRFANGSKVEIVSGSESAFRGPHPNLVHFDELDDAEDPRAFEASRMCAVTKNGIPAQNLVTSTRQNRGGLMDRLVEEIQADIAAGRDPVYALSSWCLLECIQNQAHSCQVANPDLPEEQKCRCNKVVKGTWESGEPRSFDSYCAGRLANSAGYMDIEDAFGMFKRVGRREFEAELMCERASSELNVLPDWRPERNIVKNFVPLADYGELWASVDFGYTNPTASIFALLTLVELEAEGAVGNKIVLPVGSVVVYDESYKARLSTAEQIANVKAKRDLWDGQGCGTPKGIFYDVQGAQSAADWMKAGLLMKRFTKKDVKTSTKMVANLDDAGLLFVDARCRHLLSEINGWIYGKVDGEPLKDGHRADHAVDSLRYLVANLRAIYPGWGIAGGPDASPPQRQQVGRPAASDHGYMTPDPGAFPGDGNGLWITVEDR